MTTLTRRLFGPLFHWARSVPERPASWVTRVSVPGVELPFVVVFYRDEAGWYIGAAPELPGCVTQGETREAFLANIAEAIEGCRLTRLAEGRPEREELREPVPVLP